jgi:inosine/xanthosine triphosphatase
MANMKVLVGSTNSTKVEAVKQAFEGVFPGQKWEVEGAKVDSGVSEQPLDEEETVRGARNRVKELKKHGPADYYVGIEGGLIHGAGTWLECGWVVVESKAGVEGISSSTKMMISDGIYEMLKDGEYTLSHAVEKYLGVKNAGEKTGYFGLMTNEYVDRMHAYADAVGFALARFAHPEVFED